MNCHNGEKFLCDAIKSIYAQTYSNWEIIFWDNASNDASKEIALSFDHKIKYFLTKNKTTLGEARNLALKKAKGEYICFLDCDDLYYPQKLERQVNLMQEGEFPLCYGSAKFINENNKKIRNFPANYKSGFIFNKLLLHYEINMQSVMLNHSYLTQHGLNFKTDMQYCPDHNLFMQIAAINKIGVDSSYLVKYRIVPNSLSSKTIYLAGFEVRLTLNKILKKYQHLERQFKNEFKLAYAKCDYYDAVSSIYNHDYKKAKKLLFPIIYLKYQFIALYFLLLFRTPRKFILKILNRYV